MRRRPLQKASRSSLAQGTQSSPPGKRNQTRRMEPAARRPCPRFQHERSTNPTPREPRNHSGDNGVAANRCCQRSDDGNHAVCHDQQRNTAQHRLPHRGRCRSSRPNESDGILRSTRTVLNHGHNDSGNHRHQKQHQAKQESQRNSRQKTHMRCCGDLENQKGTTLQVGTRERCDNHGQQQKKEGSAAWRYERRINGGIFVLNS